MSKKIYCAQCGQELLSRQKAIASLAMVITVVEPHTCDDTCKMPEGVPFVPIPKIKKDKGNLDKAFDSFKMVQQLNELDKKKTVFDPEGPGDLRPQEDIKQNTTAPAGVLAQLKTK